MVLRTQRGEVYQAASLAGGVTCIDQLQQYIHGPDRKDDDTEADFVDPASI